MSIPTNPVVVGAATKKSDYDDLYNGSVLANTGGTPGGAQSIPGNKTFSATTTFNSGILASGTSSVFALSNKINLRAGFVASGTCTYYAPVSGEESAGTLHLIPEDDRPSWVLSAGVSTSFVDVDFGSYVPVEVKALYLGYMTRWYGDGSLDAVEASLRKNGSTATSTEELTTVGFRYTNLASVTQAGVRGYLIVNCDSDGIIEYLVSDGDLRLYLHIQGYYI